MHLHGTIESCICIDPPKKSTIHVGTVNVSDMDGIFTHLNGWFLGDQRRQTCFILPWMAAEKPREFSSTPTGMGVLGNQTVKPLGSQTEGPMSVEKTNQFPSINNRKFTYLIG